MAGQPIITQANHEPQPGNLFVLHDHDSTILIPRNTGAAQYWDFTAVKPAPSQNSAPLVFTYSYTQAGATSGVSMFPGATIALNIYNGAEFYKSVPGSTAQLEYLGLFSLGSHTITTTESKIVNKWPMAFGDAYTDLFSGTRNYGNGQNSISGTISVSASGYGTLALPGGNTFNNVLQVTSEETQVSTASGYTETIQPFTQRYYLGSIREPLLVMADDNKKSTTDSVSILINKQIIAGLNEASATGLGIYPNPAGQFLYVDFAHPTTRETHITITEVSGRKVKEIAIAVGTQRSEIEIHDLTSGSYILYVAGRKRPISRTFIKK